MEKRIMLSAGISAVLVLFFSLSFAGEQTPEKISFGGFGFIEDGMVQGGKWVTNGKSIEIGPGNISLLKSAINLKWESTIGERWNIVVQPELQSWSPTMLETWATAELGAWRPKTNYTFVIQNGFLRYSFGNTERPPLSITLGTFLYKYNPDAVNLGEYLFRSGAYPGYLINDFDFTYARLTGLGFNSTLFGSLRQDLLITSETDIEPLRDISVSYVAGYGLGKIIDVGAGISLWRILPACDSATMPRTKIYPDNIYFNENGDTSFYTFAGTKLMARASLDVKPLLGGLFKSVLGANDLKIHGEAAVLGLKDYYAYKDTVFNADPITGAGDSGFVRKPGYYDSLWQRIPVTLGINWPTHQFASYCILPGLMAYGLESVKDKKTLRAIEYGLPSIALGICSWLIDRKYHTSTKPDLLALDLEWYGSRWPNNFYRKRYDLAVWPAPGLGTGATVPDNNPYSIGVYDYHRDDWKWSVYLKKNIANVVTLKAQIARDHIRHRMDSQDSKLLDENEMLSRESHWYWDLKMQYAF